MFSKCATSVFIILTITFTDEWWRFLGMTHRVLNMRIQPTQVSVVKKCSGYFFSWSVLSILLMMPPSSLRYFSQVWDLGLHSCFCKLTSNLMLSLMRVFSVWNCLYFIKVKLICESSTLIPLFFFLILIILVEKDSLFIVLFGILRTEF